MFSFIQEELGHHGHLPVMVQISGWTKLCSSVIRNCCSFEDMSLWTMALEIFHSAFMWYLPSHENYTFHILIVFLDFFFCLQTLIGLKTNSFCILLVQLSRFSVSADTSLKNCLLIAYCIRWWFIYAFLWVRIFFSINLLENVVEV